MVSSADVVLIVAPYDSGRREWRMGAGPRVLARAIRERLTRRGVHVHEVEVEPEGSELEIAASFQLYRRIAREAAGARAAGHLPVVLAGNCGSTLGAVVHHDAGATSVVWFDAHGDFNTPETTTSGFLDGMGLAALTGRCWTALTATIPGFAPVDPRDVLLAGARDVDEAEQALLDAAGVTRLGAVPDHPMRAAMRRWIHVRHDHALHVHLDADVLDRASVGAANAYACDGGYTVDALLAAADAIEHVRLAGLSIASYDPTCDATGAVRGAVVEFVERLLLEH